MKARFRTLVTGTALAAAIGLSIAGTTIASAHGSLTGTGSVRSDINLKAHQCLATYHNTVVTVGHTTVEARLALRACLRTAYGVTSSSSMSSSSTSSGSSVSSRPPRWWRMNKDPHDNRDGAKHEKEGQDNEDHGLGIKGGLRLGSELNGALGGHSED